MKRASLLYGLSAVGLTVLAWPHLFLKSQVPVDGNVLRLFYPNWVFLHSHPPLPWRWPLWNPYRDMGEPFLADPQSLAAYPPVWLLCRLPSYLSFMRLWILGHTLLAGYFMRRWVLSSYRQPAAAAAAAIIVMMNGFFMGHGSLPNHFAAAAYVPAALYFFDQGRIVELGAALALQWLAGFPPFSLLTGLALGGWALLAGASKRKLLLQAGGLALGLAAFQMVPFAELLANSSRSVFLGSSAAAVFSEPWRQLLRMTLVPQWFAWRPQLLGDQAVVSFYVGPFVLLAAAWAAWKGRRRERLVLAGIVISAVLSLGARVPGYDHVSLLRLFRFPANWLLIVSVGLAYLSGAGVAKLPSRWRWAGASLIALDLLVFAQYVRVPWFKPAYLEEPPPLAQKLLASSARSRIYHAPIVTEALSQQIFKDMGDYIFLKEALSPSYGMAFGLREVSSYQVLKLTRAERFHQALAQQGPSSPLLGWAGVSTVITRTPGPGPWGPGNLLAVSVPGARPPLFFDEKMPLGKIDVLEDRPAKIRASVETGRAGTLVYSSVAYPGWRVLVDGIETEPAAFQDTFLAVRLPPGRHDVTFDYRPWTFWLGLALSLVALACIPWLRNPSPT